jgi:tRNA (guanine10-N2)-dimethyltransferase
LLASYRYTKSMDKDFNAKTLCILGRQPELGIAELESLYGPEHVRPIPGATLMDLDAEDINFGRLGGTIKLAKVLAVIPAVTWSEFEKYLLENLPKHLEHAPKGKLTIGLSVYGIEVPVEHINKMLLVAKKNLRGDRPIRVVPNKSPALNSAQVLHNKLTHSGAFEFVLFRKGNQTILARTLFVQDIEAYGARDQARPRRDSRIGMLPPKLAQIIINLANPPARTTVLDPFCGTGVILQEALLMGFNVVGTDIDKRMVDYAATNVEWLQGFRPQILGSYQIEIGDAREYTWPSKVSVAASEVYLGPPMHQAPKPAELAGIMHKVNGLLEAFLRNIAPQLDDSARIALAVPAWRGPNSKFRRLYLLDHLGDLGYNLLDFKHVNINDLIYFRENQIVARQLVVLIKK